MHFCRSELMALPRVSLDQNSSVGPADWYLGVGGQVCSGLIRVLAGPGLGSCRIDVRLLPIGQPSPALSSGGLPALLFLGAGTCLDSPCTQISLLLGRPSLSRAPVIRWGCRMVSLSSGCLHHITIKSGVTFTGPRGLGH